MSNIEEDIKTIKSRVDKCREEFENFGEITFSYSDLDRIENILAEREADKIEDKEIEDFLKYLKVANEICKEKGKMYEFECPLCNGNAKAIKNTYNGHLWSKCENCDMNVIQ